MLTAVLLISTLVALAGGRIYDRCELARDLLRLGVSRGQVSTWVCIAFHESRFNTAAWNTHSGDHGLLQISELYWCGPGKACGMTCSSLRDTDITNDVQCALRIYREHSRLQGDGFMAWVVYPQFCRGNMNYVKDCNRLGKSYSEKLYNISQRLPKPNVLNFTTPQFVDTGNVDRPLPSYLAVNSLIREVNFEKFERDYYNEHKRKFDWQNFKIDNIDELKLPVANRRSRVEFATPPTAITHTTVTTDRITTTPDAFLKGIKPPSPRLIESNQFRMRKTKLKEESYKTDNTSSFTSSRLLPISSSTTTTTTPRIDKDLFSQTTHNYYSNINKTQTTMKTISTHTTITTQTTLKELSSQSVVENVLPLTSVKPKAETTLRTTEDANSENPIYKGTQKPTTKPATTRAVTSQQRNDPIYDFTFYSSSSGTTATPRADTTPYISEGNKSRVIEVTTKEPRYTFSNSTYNRIPNTTFQISNNNQSISLSTSDTNKNSGITSTTPSIINISEKTKDYVSIVNTTKPSTVYDYDVHNILNNSFTSQTTAGPSFITKPQSYSEPTTQRPQTTKLDSDTSAATTKQSIFDLYLRPTRRPALKPFSFAPFNKNPFRVRIFSGGTTPSPSGENGG